MSALEVEFTVEPFVEATIGPHVRAAIDAAEAHGVAVDIGPFSSSFTAPVDTAATAVHDLLTAAAAAGASRIALQVRITSGGPA